MQVYTDSKKCSDYLTAGKFYDVIDTHEDILGTIEDDEGFEIVIRFKGCHHLKGDDWTVVE